MTFKLKNGKKETITTVKEFNINTIFSEELDKNNTLSSEKCNDDTLTFSSKEVDEDTIFNEDDLFGKKANKYIVYNKSFDVTDDEVSDLVCKYYCENDKIVVHGKENETKEESCTREYENNNKVSNALDTITNAKSNTKSNGTCIIL